MQQYKVTIQDRSYTSWSYNDYETMKHVELPLVVPGDNQLFTNDVFTVDENGSVQIVHSTIRSSTDIPGVLVLKNNKTYGRKNGSAGGKLLYKCVPDDNRIPCFLVPYEIKNMGFSKIFPNIYITFQFKEWTEKHPHATIIQTIGAVDVLDHFYEYQLYCKSLHSSIQKFTKDTNNALKPVTSHDTFIENIRHKYPSIENRTDWKVFSIDPENSVDFDDAFSIRSVENGLHMLSIYISNVTIWMDVLNLWDSFSRRISTIYLPDRKRPMLPTILSDCLCSLQSNCTRIAFVMDVLLDVETGDIKDISYSNCMIRAYKNYIYEEPALLVDENYTQLMKITKKISRTYKYLSHVRNSHDVVCYWMIWMNYNTAKRFIPYKNGIFRSTVLNRNVAVPEDIPEDVGKFIQMWNSSAGQYIDMGTLQEGETMAHDLMEMDSYIHITSPIRRLVDVLNMIQFQMNTGMIALSEGSIGFYKKWLNDLEYINTTMRAIRRVQNDCSLLHYCTNSPDVLGKVYEGYAFDKLKRSDELFQMVVFLPELKLTSRVVIREDLENYKKYEFKLFLFHDEEKFKKKIRLQLVNYSIE